MSFDAVLGAAERPQIVYPSLSRRPTLSEWEIRLGVIQVHPPNASSVGKAAGWHPQEHRLLDPAWNLVAIDRGDTLLALPTPSVESRKGMQTFIAARRSRAVTEEQT